MADQETGSILDGRFKILSQLGEGGMGTVYRALHRDMDRQVAIKVLKTGFGYASEQQLRFRNEAQLISSLDHPNIVSVYSIGVAENGMPYIAMELLEGRALSEIIKESGSLPYRRALPLFIQACDALEHAHRKGIIHRDIKPSNLVLVGMPDADPTIKVVDFGIAKALSGDSITQTNVVVGSAFYLSPGQCEGRRPDAQSDIYSLGCSLFETLSGRPPFIGDHYFDTMQKHRSDDHPRIKSVNHNYDAPESLEAIIDCCLEKEADSRYKSVADLRHDLLNVLEGKTPERIPERTVRKPIRLLGKRSAIISTACGVGLLAVATIIGISTVFQPTLREKFIDLEGERTKVRQTIELGHAANVEMRHDTAELLLLRAYAGARELGDPLLKGKAAAEIRISYESLAGKGATRPFDMNARSLSMLTEAVSGIESDMLSGKLKDTTSAHDQLFQSLESLMCCLNDPDALQVNGKKALTAYYKGYRAVEEHTRLIHVLTMLVDASLDSGKTEQAVTYAKQRLDVQRQRGVQEKLIKAELLKSIGKAQSLHNSDAVERLRALIK